MRPTLIVLLLAACTHEASPRPTALPCGGGLCPDPIKISELMADNSATWVDELGQTEDWIELVNTGDARVWLAGYSLSDAPGTYALLPETRWLEPGEVLLLFADADPGE